MIESYKVVEKKEGPIYFCFDIVIAMVFRKDYFVAVVIIAAANWSYLHSWNHSGRQYYQMHSKSTIIFVAAKDVCLVIY